MLSVGEAMRRIVQSARALPVETVPLRAALGRVLAHDVRSTVSLPPWDNSSMDGFAVRADDVRGASRERPALLRVTGTIAAGGRADVAVERGTAIRIMTGAPVPAGADTVIRIEDTEGAERDGAVHVRIFDDRDVMRNVRPLGEDIRPGTLAVGAGETLTPAMVGVLASIGCARVDVYRRAQVAILATGDELVDVADFEAVERGERIVSSNSYTLASSLAEMGAGVLDLGIARDDLDDLRGRFASAAGCDLLITTGGISVGDFDYTRAALASLGGTLDFWRVAMRPGAPLGFGHVEDLPWLGLPGNPVSALVTFELFGRPLIRRLSGVRRAYPSPVPVIMDEEARATVPRTHFLRAIIHRDDDGRMHARLTGPQGSGVLTSMAMANALVVVPGDSAIHAGERADALLLGCTALHAEEPWLA